MTTHPNFDRELAYDHGCTAMPKTNLHPRLVPMADLLGSITDSVHSGELQALDALDLHDQAATLLADLFGSIRAEYVPSVPSHSDRFEEAMNS